jgi:hypothetical protein
LKTWKRNLCFVLKGISLGNIALNERDGLGIWDTNAIKITANSSNAEILMEVPMKL